ncbi:quinolinate synthase NadA [Clostridia bacterium]|nr:quinolinate synthase NadA [Clostridia bacterium]
MDTTTMMNEIRRLKQEKNVIIMAHLYQPDEIQAVADYTGDSLGLSRLAKEAKESVIMFCGVKFMAETAKILSPNKRVVLPRMDALCFMAAMVNEEEIHEMRKKHPGAAVVSYVNSTTEVKAVSDYCCTSANAVNLCRNIPEQEVIFVPDKNLGAYIAQQVPEKSFYFVSGFCPTHHRLSIEDVEQARKDYPGVRILAHPECQRQVLDLVDFIGSTSQILSEAKESDEKRLIIATEEGTLYRLRKESPEKEFILLSNELVCENMKRIKLEDLYQSMLTLEPEITVEEELRAKASVALERMLQFS